MIVSLLQETLVISELRTRVGSTLYCSFFSMKRSIAHSSESQSWSSFPGRCQCFDVALLLPIQKLVLFQSSSTYDIAETFSVYGDLQHSFGVFC